MSSSSSQPPPHIDTTATALEQQQHHHQISQNNNTAARPPSPKAPAYSPITPKVQPILPVTNNAQPPFMPPPENGGSFTFRPPASDPPPPQPQQRQENMSSQQRNSAIPPTEYIPQPPNLPFSGEDATDAIALRAAISSLQFQKQRAEEDIRKLEGIKKSAMVEPARFRKELESGRLREQRSRTGDFRAILDQAEEGDEEDEVVLGAERDEEDENENMDLDTPQKPFPRIPGPQDVVRMPYVNWEKYHVLSAPLDALHGQQKRWPGSAPFARDKGREQVVAAPYSPFLDTLEERTGMGRKDSAGVQQSSPGAEERRK